MTHVCRLAVVVAAICAASSGGVSALTPFPLLGTVWAWQAVAADGGARTAIEAPERYTIELLPDGDARVRADCNRGRGRYEANDVELRFGPIATTKIGCPSGSRDRAFLAALGRIDQYRFEGVELVLATKDGRSTMRFKPARS